jgi:hypothetical protein
MGDGEGPTQLQTVLLKGAAVLVGICVLVALGTFVMVKALGLDGGGGTRSATTAALEPQPVSPLPTTALPVPGQSQSPGGGQTQTGPGKKAHHRPQGSHGFHLSATPVSVRPMQRINLTGTYAGHDNMSIVVQSTQSGSWAPFAGVTAQVNLGTFQTYVMSGVHGTNKFRMFDPSTGKASNPVTVTVG